MAARIEGDLVKQPIKTVSNPHIDKPTTFSVSLNDVKPGKHTKMIPAPEIPVSTPRSSNNLLNKFLLD